MIIGDFIPHARHVTVSTEMGNRPTHKGWQAGGTSKDTSDESRSASSELPSSTILILATDLGV